MAAGDFIRDNSTINQVTDPLGVVGMMGQGGTWFDPMNFFGMGPGLPNPADAGMGYFDKIPDTLKPYYDPYINAGKESLGTLMGQYNSLVKDPNALMSQAGKTFQESPGYQYRLNQGTNAINNAAAAGGMLGTPYHQQNAGDMASNMASGEWNNYLGNYLGNYQMGMGGLSNINQMGYNASDSLAQSLGANLMNQGQLAYQGQVAQNKGKQGIAGNLMGMAGSFFGL